MAATRLSADARAASDNENDTEDHRNLDQRAQQVEQSGHGDSAYQSFNSEKIPARYQFA